MHYVLCIMQSTVYPLPQKLTQILESSKLLKKDRTVLIQKAICQEFVLDWLDCPSFCLWPRLSSNEFILRLLVLLASLHFRMKVERAEERNIYKEKKMKNTWSLRHKLEVQCEWTGEDESLLMRQGRLPLQFSQPLPSPHLQWYHWVQQRLARMQSSLAIWWKGKREHNMSIFIYI